MNVEEVMKSKWKREVTERIRKTTEKEIRSSAKE